MSLCQSEKVSCGSCCGLFNLNIPITEYKTILQDRTRDFESQTSFDKQYTFATYRRNREQIESTIPKKDETTYNCPFLGYIEPSQKKVGCLIHPQRTNDPSSQNYSFYGASICQTYDCKTKEKPTAELWRNFFSEMDLDFIEYSQIAANHRLIAAMEQYYQEKGMYSLEEWMKREEVKIKKLLQESWERFQFLTSFEFDYESGSVLEKLARALGTSVENEILTEWKN